MKIRESHTRRGISYACDKETLLQASHWASGGCYTSTCRGREVFGTEVSRAASDRSWFRGSLCPEGTILGFLTISRLQMPEAQRQQGIELSRLLIPWPRRSSEPWLTSAGGPAGCWRVSGEQTHCPRSLQVNTRLQERADGGIINGDKVWRTYSVQDTLSLRWYVYIISKPQIYLITPMVERFRKETQMQIFLKTKGQNETQWNESSG